MVIKSIQEIPNDDLEEMKPIKEIMSIEIPDIITDGISKRNGMIYILTGSGGSGKTSLLLNMFKSKEIYKKKFHNIYYIISESSFLSVADHPFKDHDKVYHELTSGLLSTLYNELMELKEERIKKKRKPHYNIVVIDDMADRLKDKDIALALSKMLIKARHLNTGFIFTLQAYYYFPKLLRRQLTFCTIFKPKNYQEFEALSVELFNLNKDDALKLYNYVFSEPYAHLDVDTVLNKYYRNFNLLLLKE